MKSTQILLERKTEGEKHEKEDIRDTRLRRPCCNHGRSVSHPVQIWTSALTGWTAAYYSMSCDRI